MSGSARRKPVSDSPNAASKTDTRTALILAAERLIARHGIGEEEAHRRVQKMSMERNLPLADMARQIIEAEDLLC